MYSYTYTCIHNIDNAIIAETGFTQGQPTFLRRFHTPPLTRQATCLITSININNAVHLSTYYSRQ